MGNSYGDPQQQRRSHDDNRGNFSRGRGPGGRNSGGREGGGFRIRLSDNEMKAASSIQEAFNLRSTVAVLGFALRALAQMLEEGKLDELIAQSRAQTSKGSDRRGEGRQGSRKNRSDNEFKSTSKPNPFARPEKPQASNPEKDQEEALPEITTNDIDSEENDVNDLNKVSISISQENQETNESTDKSEVEESAEPSEN